MCDEILLNEISANKFKFIKKISATKFCIAEKMSANKFRLIKKIIYQQILIEKKTVQPSSNCRKNVWEQASAWNNSVRTNIDWKKTWQNNCHYSLKIHKSADVSLLYADLAIFKLATKNLAQHLSLDL